MVKRSKSRKVKDEHRTFKTVIGDRLSVIGKTLEL